MLKIQQKIEVLSDGELKKCNHVYIPRHKNGKLSFFKLQHVMEHVCFSCGRHEVVITKIVREGNPFTFNKTVERFLQKGTE